MAGTNALVLLGTAAAGVATAVGAYLTGRRNTSGSISNSSADIVWAENTKVKQDLKDEILRIREEAAAAREEIAEARKATEYWQKESHRLAQEVHGLRNQLHRAQAELEDIHRTWERGRGGD